MRNGKLFTKRDGVETAVLSAGQNRFFYGPVELTWFAIRQNESGNFVFVRHVDGGDKIDTGIRTGPVPSLK